MIKTKNKINIFITNAFFLIITFGNLLKNINIVNAINTINARKDMCQILSFSGGGSFGAVEVGILSKIMAKNNFANYDMITGVSAGGLNAGFLSYYNLPNVDLSKGIENLANIYFNLKNEDVYERDTMQIYKSWSYYDTTPLKNTIHSELNKLNELAKLNGWELTNSHPTLIGSTNLNSGGFQIFRFDKETLESQVNILMATSAIPLVFPPILINSNHYVDGGVISNEIIHGIDGYLGCKKYNITFITSTIKINTVDSIESFEQFIKRTGQIIIASFNNQLTEIIQNPCDKAKSNGNIHYCYPTTDKLDEYSILDFTHGKELYDIGRDNFECDIYNYC